MTVQNHIHLDETLGGSPENAPIRTWVATELIDIPEVIMELQRSRTGKLWIHILEDVDGPVLLNHYGYNLKLTASDLTAMEQLAIIKGWYGRRLKLVTHNHIESGSDHTPYVKNVVLSKVEPEYQDTRLQIIYVKIELTDDSL